MQISWFADLNPKLMGNSQANFGTNFVNLCLTYAAIWAIYYVYCQNSIYIMGCHGNGKISYDPNGSFLEDIFFSYFVCPNE